MTSNGISSAFEAIETAGQTDATETVDSATTMEVVPAMIRTRYTDRLVRPDSTFVAHLMAIDQQYPQTREWLRAEPAQAMAAYRSVVGQNHSAAQAGERMRRHS